MFSRNCYKNAYNFDRKLSLIVCLWEPGKDTYFHRKIRKHFQVLFRSDSLWENHQIPYCYPVDTITIRYTPTEGHIFCGDEYGAYQRVYVIGPTRVILGTRRSHLNGWSFCKYSQDILRKLLEEQDVRMNNN